MFCDERLTKTRIIRKIERILLQQKSPGWNWLVYDPVIKPKADIVHTFNSVCKIGKIPWVVTFESTIPRTNQTVGRKKGTVHLLLIILQRVQCDF